MPPDSFDGAGDYSTSVRSAGHTRRPAHVAPSLSTPPAAGRDGLPVPLSRAHLRHPRGQQLRAGNGRERKDRRRRHGDLLARAKLGGGEYIDNSRSGTGR